MKKLIVYYSFEGSTEYFANELAKEIGAEILRLKPIKEHKSKGFSKFIWGGHLSVMKKRPLLEAYNFDPRNYETIIFASPVWAGNFAPPLLTFFDNEDIIGKKVAYFYCYQGGARHVEKNIKEALSDNHFIDTIGLLTNKVSVEENRSKLIKWAKSAEL